MKLLLSIDLFIYLFVSGYFIQNARREVKFHLNGEGPEIQHLLGVVDLWNCVRN